MGIGLERWESSDTRVEGKRKEDGRELRAERCKEARRGGGRRRKEEKTKTRTVKAIEEKR